MPCGVVVVNNAPREKEGKEGISSMKFMSVCLCVSVCAARFSAAAAAAGRALGDPSMHYVAPHI